MSDSGHHFEDFTVNPQPLSDMNTESKNLFNSDDNTSTLWYK